MQGRTLLVSGYVFLVTLAAPAALFASEDPGAVLPGEPVGAPPDSEAQAADPAIGGTEPASGSGAPPQGAAGEGTGSRPPAPVTDAPEVSAATGEPPQTGKGRHGEDPEATASATSTVLMRDLEFNPRNLTIDPGDTVRWENEDSEPHNAIGEDDSFETPVIDQGETSEHTFQGSGKYPYFCTIHPGMDGTITVRGSGSGSGSGGSGSGGSGSGNGSGDTASGTGGTSASGGSGGGTSATGSGGTTDSSSNSSLPATGLDLLWLGLIGWGLGALGAGLLLLGPRDV
jgi:plastocyanin